ncbi:MULTISPECIES: TorD/DmsD family molecular chaperone [unclassified Candidatus Frackibacter]|uniref:TorD/DmsD family molecular chaperone n=1 Tax=unclassified Candidatus Frackibacter TaxID=2648818 RepID=UPI00088CEA8E|nr:MULTISPECIES: molecular chaperone TorD family protein [unclassified Candidatus Frackibacter]SDC00070.1 DMSO reductase family type II enzyme chaperone [Candidatus Frackibacter sp. WG11]SEM31630.1 DMSO reductase family type II enzyme chaperone [Candidatus Frackibacter sp. WG12]SFL36559.1 DMSO reductase family type II enzyme chaperone [Candidatus Frackibacter sp. WG13]
MNLKEVLSLQKARENTYKLLSTLFYLPEEDLFESQVLDNLITSTEVIFDDLREYAVSLQDEGKKISNIEDLKVDYSKLFVGPFDLFAPPYGSIYLEKERKVMGDSTINVLNKYKQAGLKVADDFKDAPDHIIMELEFMYFLTFNQIEAINSSDFSSTLHYLEMQRDFLGNHLRVWISEFTDRILNNTNTEFYKILAKLTENFIINDYEQFIDRITDEVDLLKNN